MDGMTAHRVLSVEEARALPPPLEEELERRRSAIRAMSAITQRAFERRGGVPIPWEEIEQALEWDDEPDDVGK